MVQADVFSLFRWWSSSNLLYTFVGCARLGCHDVSRRLRRIVPSVELEDMIVKRDAVLC